MNGKLLGRYDANAVSARLEEAGVYTALGAKGFSRFEVIIDTPESGIAHTRLFAWKRDGLFPLLDACVTELTLPPEHFQRRGYPLDRALDLVLLYWLREEDPTAGFSSDRPPLPLQRHPGLGILRAAFRVIVGMTRDLGRDGIACMPKFFHDAVIFFRSRLFLFLDPVRQGRFEALVRDLHTLPMGTASLLFAVDGVRDSEGCLVCWDLAPQVLPLSDTFRAYFNSPHYSEAAAAAFAESRFSWSDDAMVRAYQLAQASLSGQHMCN